MDDELHFKHRQCARCAHQCIVLKPGSNNQGIGVNIVDQRYLCCNVHHGVEQAIANDVTDVIWMFRIDHLCTECRDFEILEKPLKKLPVFKL